MSVCCLETHSVPELEFNTKSYTHFLPLSAILFLHKMSGIEGVMTRGIENIFCPFVNEFLLFSHHVIEPGTTVLDCFLAYIMEFWGEDKHVN